ncbi:MAG: hypothetical protein WCL44_04795 [bacterium]
MAEYLLRRRLGEKSEWKVISAGTAALAGLRATRYSVEAMADIGIDISGHKSRPLTGDVVDSAAVIITMTRWQRDEIVSLYPRAVEKVFTLGAIADGSPGRDVDDPMGMSGDDYKRTRDEIDEMMPDVVLFLRGQESEQPV